MKLPIPETRYYNFPEEFLMRHIVVEYDCISIINGINYLALLPGSIIVNWRRRNIHFFKKIIGQGNM
jgi:hypothetical protein